MPAIKAVNSKGLRVLNCKFVGFETDIELDNVEDFVSENNQFSGQSKPQLLLCELSESIRRSEIPRIEKERISREVVELLSKGRPVDERDRKELITKLGRYVGNKAVDYFVQLSAAVSAGLILRKL